MLVLSAAEELSALAGEGEVDGQHMHCPAGRRELESEMGNNPTRKLRNEAKQRHNDNRRGSTRKKKRKVRLNLGPLKLYIEDEFEELVQDEADGDITPVRRRMLLLKAVPLGLIAWVTDVVSIFVHMSK